MAGSFVVCSEASVLVLVVSRFGFSLFFFFFFFFLVFVLRASKLKVCLVKCFRNKRE